MNKPDPKTVGLPVRPFLYTADQIANLISVPVQKVYDEYLFYAAMMAGTPKRHQMTARNIAPEGARPDWRVSEVQLTKWLRRMGFKIFERAYVEE